MEAVTDSEIKKRLYGKLISESWRKFKEWWEKNKKPQVAKKVKESILKQLKVTKQQIEEEKKDRKNDMNKRWGPEL